MLGASSEQEVIRQQKSDYKNSAVIHVVDPGEKNILDSKLYPYSNNKIIIHTTAPLSRFSAASKEASLWAASCVNHRATAHLLPFVTAVTPCMFSLPAEKPTIRPHLGSTKA